MTPIKVQVRDIYFDFENACNCCCCVSPLRDKHFAYVNSRNNIEKFDKRKATRGDEIEKTTLRITGFLRTRLKLIVRDHYPELFNDKGRLDIFVNGILANLITDSGANFFDLSTPLSVKQIKDLNKKISEVTIKAFEYLETLEGRSP